MLHIPADSTKPSVILKEALSDVAIVKAERSAWIDSRTLRETACHGQEPVVPGQR